MKDLARITKTLDFFLSPELRKLETRDIIRMRFLVFAILAVIPIGFVPCLLFRDVNSSASVWMIQGLANLIVSIGLLGSLKRTRDYRRIATASVLWMHVLFVYSLLGFPSIFSLVYLWSSFLVVMSSLIMGMRGALLSFGCLTVLSLLTMTSRYVHGTKWMILNHDIYVQQLVLGLIGSSILTAAVTGVYEFMRDTNEQHQTRQRLLAARHAHTGAVGELVGHVAHEVNNPLAILQGSVTRLRRHLERNEWRHEGRKLLGNMQRSHERIIRVQQSLAIFASGHQHEPFVSQDVRLILKDVQLAMKPQALAQQVALEFHDPGKTLTLRCQPHQLVYVLCSLIQNSLDACRDHRHPEIHVSVRDVDWQLIFAVSDNGKGIDLGAQDKVFQPFFTTKTGGNAQGLSLSVSRGILARHGGEISFESRPGATIFTCQVPRDPATALHIAKGA
ncbi:MAG TPA: HAMP domain-containing sensor histidine kinase [Oligoflexus sp.]|uniref:sensor histidine kinase n=1 Tax=Oligoflexus sp. TaxID=1971216 RepID=UPI002D7EA122|nr:HAMP domain-containing sensor histidine kinase [Oligoflexus sp.]HET9236017.1 HAMP domain-containing sensor histidine kinase [Oligoflexus sp.]